MLKEKIINKIINYNSSSFQDVLGLASNRMVIILATNSSMHGLAFQFRINDDQNKLHKYIDQWNKQYESKKMTHVFFLKDMHLMDMGKHLIT